MIRCKTPAPRSKPSSTTYAVIITATSQNQMKSMIRYLLRRRDRITCRNRAFRSRRRAMRDLAVYQHQKQNGQHGVQPHETDQSEQAIAGMNIFRIAFRGAHEAIDQPGLPSDLRSHPTRGVGNIGQRQAEHDDPEQPARFIQLSAPQQKRARGHHGDENRPKAGHDVIAVIEQRNIRRPLVFRKFVQTLYLGRAGAIDQEAQNFVHYHWIVNALMFFIGLPKDDHGRAIFRLKQSFHRGGSDGLVARHVFAVKVAGGEDLQRGENYAGNHADPHKDTRMFNKLSFEKIKSAHAGHYECRRNYRAAHVVRILQERPWIQQQSPETDDLETSVGRTLECYGMLHPCVGDDDEVPGEPRAKKHQEGRPPVSFGAEAFFAIQEQSQERGFKKEREHALHHQRLADHAAGDAREMRPVGAELEFHGNPGDHAENEVDPKYFCPETGGLIVSFLVRAQCQGLQYHDQQGQPHGELRKEVMKRRGKSKMKPVNQQRAIHAYSLVGHSRQSWMFLTHNRMAGRTRKQMAIQKLNRNRQTDDVIYLTLGGDACGSADAAWLIDNHPCHRLPILFFLGSVHAVRALVHSQAVDFVLDRKVFQLAEVVR